MFDMLQIGSIELSLPQQNSQNVGTRSNRGHRATYPPGDLSNRSSRQRLFTEERPNLSADLHFFAFATSIAIFKASAVNVF
jgi:hypothetical protein